MLVWCFPLMIIMMIMIMMMIMIIMIMIMLTSGMLWTLRLLTPLVWKAFCTTSFPDSE